MVFILKVELFAAWRPHMFIDWKVCCGDTKSKDDCKDFIVFNKDCLESRHILYIDFVLLYRGKNVHYLQQQRKYCQAQIQIQKYKPLA